MELLFQIICFFFKGINMVMKIRVKKTESFFMYIFFVKVLGMDVFLIFSYLIIWLKYKVIDKIRRMVVGRITGLNVLK